jgi:RNA-directed DNA polymerase
LLGYKTLIRPSQEAVKRHYQDLVSIIDEYQNASQAQLIKKLNPVVRGWARYYSAVVSKKTFSKLTHLMFVKLWHWAKFRHSNKPRRWTASKYWHPNKGKWQFATPDSQKLYEHSHMPIQRHVKVKGRKSPYDGDWVYWVNRKAAHPEIPTRIAKLVKRQSGRCTWCGLYFRSEDWLEVDHVIPTVMGGRDTYANWQLLHKHCHHQKTAWDRQSQQSAVLMIRAN